METLKKYWVNILLFIAGIVYLSRHYDNKTEGEYDEKVKKYTEDIKRIDDRIQKAKVRKRSKCTNSDRIRSIKLLLNKRLNSLKRKAISRD